MINLFVRFVVIVSVLVPIVDMVGFYPIQNNPEALTIPFVILMIIGTLLPITINLWYWLAFKQRKSNSSRSSFIDMKRPRFSPDKKKNRRKP